MAEKSWIVKLMVLLMKIDDNAFLWSGSFLRGVAGLTVWSALKVGKNRVPHREAGIPVPLRRQQLEKL
jgi:hypothetical protein